MLLGPGDGGVAEALDQAGVHLEAYADLESLAAAGDTGMTIPEAVLVVCDRPAPTAERGTVPEATGELLAELLGTCRDWLADDRFASSRLVVVTREAVAAGADPGVGDVAAAALWGLLRSVQLEHPRRGYNSSTWATRRRPERHSSRRSPPHSRRRRSATPRSCCPPRHGRTRGGRR